MIKEALEYLVGLGKNETFELNGMMYNTKRFNPVAPQSIVGFNVSTLSSVVEYVKKNFDEIEETFVLKINSPTKVELCTNNIYPYNDRNVLLTAEQSLPSIQFDRFIDSEMFNIQLTTKFVATEDASLIVRLLSNVTEEASKKVKDDGVKQTLNVKTGVVTESAVEVKNPVYLMPYRTFHEIRQIMVPFVLRIKEGPTAALFEADGGAWKNEAINEISNYFNEELSEFIESGKVIILA
jgi:hypothetical protein